MKISLSESKSTFKPADVNEKTLMELMTKNTWSPATYRNNHRTNENFLQTELLALDFDDGLSIEKARQVFKDYKHIIGTTRNHRREKNGIVADRFRVTLFLSNPIVDPKVYTATIADLLSSFPDADRACKDPARMFYPCMLIDTYEPSGNTVKPVWPTEKKVELPKVELKGKGTFSKLTNDFLLFGADINWNARLFKAAKDIQEQGYTIEEATELLSLATRRYEGELNADDKKSIKSAFKDEPTHEPRITNAFTFKSLKELYTTKPKMDWLVDGLLSKGGISIIAGQPKSGKSTIIRQLSANVANGGTFLGRNVVKGSVVYLALEEQEAMVYKQFKALGASEDLPIQYHIGPINKEDGFEDFHDYLIANRPSLAVIDTLVMFARIKDQNNYQEVYSAISKLRTLARQSGTHIVCIHHTRKPYGNERGMTTVMGSGAFTGAVDAIVFFENVENRRYISTQGRGTKDFKVKPLEFDEATQQYILGVNDEF